MHEDSTSTSPAPGGRHAGDGRSARKSVGRFVLLLSALPILGAALGLLVAALMPASYTAHSYVILITSPGGADGSATNVAQATARVATKTSVLDSAGADASLVSAAEKGRLTATASPDAPLVDLAASAGTAEEATRLSDGLARSTETQVNNFSKQTGVGARVFAKASAPLDPTIPNYPVSILAGLALGVLASAVIFILKRPREDLGRRSAAPYVDDRKN